MAKSVGGNMFGDASEPGVFFEHALDRTSGKATEVAGSVDGLLVVGIVEEEG